MSKEKASCDEKQAQTAQQQTAQQPEQATQQDKIKQLEEQIAQLTEEKEKLSKTAARLQSSADKSDTYLNQLVAMKNDFESYKRRMRFNAEQAKAEGVQSVALKLIEIADTFEIAQKHISDSETLHAFEMVHKQFTETLHGFGVQEMDVKGQGFRSHDNERAFPNGLRRTKQRQSRGSLQKRLHDGRKSASLRRSYSGCVKYNLKEIYYGKNYRY